MKRGQESIHWSTNSNSTEARSSASVEWALTGLISRPEFVIKWIDWIKAMQIQTVGSLLSESVKSAYSLNHELWSGNKASQGPFHWSTTSCFSGIRIRPLVDLLLTSFHIAMIECKYFSEIRNLLDYFQLKQIRFFLLFLTVIFKYLHNFFSDESCFYCK